MINLKFGFQLFFEKHFIHKEVFAQFNSSETLSLMIKMHVNLVVSFLLSASAVVWTKNVESDSLIAQYSRVFGFRLPDTFHSSYTLDEANKQAMSQSSSFSFGCSSYDLGGNIAFRNRGKGLNASIKPILVDYQTDAMCFLVLEGSTDVEEVKKSFDHTLPSEMSLKVHDSMYDSVESTDLPKFWSTVPKDVTVFYLENGFNSTDSEVKHFQGVMKGLVEYSASAFKTFFWTSDRTASFFADAPPVVANSPGFEEDMRREKIWALAVETFEREVALDSMNDPCGWRNSVAMSATGEVTISVKQR